jgi:hypothetical protein
MQRSEVSLALTWPCRLSLLRVLLCGSLCFKLSPFQAHWGGDTAPPFSGVCVYLRLTWEVGLPPSPVEFSSLHHFYKLCRSWLLCVCRCSCLLSPGLFIYSSVRDSPTLFFGAQCTPPSLLRVFIVLVAYYSVSLFFPGWVSVCPGGILIWHRVVCGSTAYRLAHLVVHVFLSRLGASIWWRPKSLNKTLNLIQKFSLNDWYVLRIL